MPKLTSAVFPGTFDPLTNGHLDIITRALNFYERVYVAVLSNSSKETLFTVQERLDQLREVLHDYPGAKVESFSGLLVDYAAKVKTRVIIRGLRAISDYDYETQVALMNRNLSSDVETFFLITREENSYISSTVVKQVAALGGNVAKFVPPIIEAALKSKFVSTKN